MIYVIIGVVMLKPGWLNRYLSEIARTVVPDVAATVGVVCAGLMFVSAAVNAYVALTYSLTAWAWFMPIFGLVSKVVVFLGGFAALRLIARRRIRALPSTERDALLASPDEPRLRDRLKARSGGAHRTPPDLKSRHTISLDRPRRLSS